LFWLAFLLHVLNQFVSFAAHLSRLSLLLSPLQRVAPVALVHFRLHMSRAEHPLAGTTSVERDSRDIDFTLEHGTSVIQLNGLVQKC
jgi:hypothetical protein